MPSPSSNSRPGTVGSGELPGPCQEWYISNSSKSDRRSSAQRLMEKWDVHAQRYIRAEVANAGPARYVSVPVFYHSTPNPYRTCPHRREKPCPTPRADDWNTLLIRIFTLSIRLSYSWGPTALQMPVPSLGNTWETRRAGNPPRASFLGSIPALYLLDPPPYLALTTARKVRKFKFQNKLALGIAYGKYPLEALALNI
jgi:hypothetical protein